jgi:hypothetical protein
MDAVETLLHELDGLGPEWQLGLLQSQNRLIKNLSREIQGNGRVRKFPSEYARRRVREYLKRKHWL